MIEGVLVPLVVVGLAELGDKTQLSILLLSSKTKQHLRLLLGVMLAFFIVDGAAILGGSLIANIVPLSVLKLCSGTIFIVVGAFVFVNSKATEEGKLYSGNPFLSGFLLILMTEWGDKTQIASGLFATKYEVWMVLIGTMAVLTLLSGMAIYLGKLISGKIDKRVMARIAGILFVTMGISTFLF